MKNLLTLITLLTVVTGFSQITIDKSSIDNGGASTTVGARSVIYTIGEVAINEATSGNIHVSEGFISTSTLGETLGVENYSPLEGIKVFPNPTTNYVNIHFKTTDTYQISLYNTNSKQLLKLNPKQTSEQTLDLKNLPNGLYLLVIKNSIKQTFKTYKIIKN